MVRGKSARMGGSLRDRDCDPCLSFVYRHQPPNRAPSDRRSLIDRPKFVCSRSIYVLWGGLYNYATIAFKPPARVHLPTGSLISSDSILPTWIGDLSIQICPIYREALHASLLAFPRVILIKHLGFASRPFNRSALRIGIMRLNLAYANQ